MVLLAVRPKRIGFHHVYTQDNDHAEWAIPVEPGGLQIDAYHDRHEPHLHWPGRYHQTVPLPGITLQAAMDAVLDHLERNDAIRVEDLVEALTR